MDRHRPLLEVDDLRVRIGNASHGVEPVAGVSFHLRRAETFALLGESGCGKSLTALSLLGLLPDSARSSGSARFSGEELIGLPERALRRLRGGRIAMIFQEPMSALNPLMSVGAQIGESVGLHQGFKGHARRERVLALLDAVGIGAARSRYDAYPHQLSGGMKQRAMIAMALAGDPELLIADEPTTALDVTTQAEVLALLGNLQRRHGMALLLITHDLGVAASVADRVAVMYAGELVEQAAAGDFFRQARHPYSGGLIAALPDGGKRDRPLCAIPGSVPTPAGSPRACRFAPRCEHAWAPCRQRAPAWFTVAGGHSVRCHRLDPALAPERRAPTAAAATVLPSRGTGSTASPLLRVRDLKVHFPRQGGWWWRSSAAVKAVDGIDFDIPVASTLALVGESGCGKSSVGRAVVQLLRPTAGSVVFDQVELTRLRGERLRRIRRRLQIVFQDAHAALNPRLRVEELVAEGLRAQRLCSNAAQRRRRVGELLAQVGLGEEHRRRYPHQLSGGQRQRICIARALAVEPELIVCDEPTSALDVSVQAQILNLLRELQARLGLSYLFISHDLAVVAYLAERIAVMYLGRIVEQGSVEEITTRPQHPYTQALLSAVPRTEDGDAAGIIRLAGEIPSPAQPPSGCHFHPRCRHRMPVCREQYPAASVRSPTHRVWCHLEAGR